MNNKIAFFTFSTDISALEQYRVYSPLQAAGFQILNGIDQQQVNLDIIHDCDVVLFQRDFPGHFDAYQAVVNRARESQKRIILDLDDDLLSLPQDHPDRISNYFTDGLLPILHAIINVDGITVTTLPLKEAIQEINPNVWVLPNYLDEQIWKMRSPQTDSESEPLTIFYMGTPTHKPDLEMISESLIQLAEVHGDKIRFYFLGVEPPSKLTNLIHFTYQPILTYDYQKFAELISDVKADIAVAPLCDNIFNRSKSAIKFFEYSAMGLPAVYSNLSPYSDVITDGHDGLLAQDSKDWFEKIQYLIEKSDLRRKIVTNAQNTIHNSWLIGSHFGEWASVYNQIIPSNAQFPLKRNPILGSLEQIIMQVDEKNTKQKQLIDHLDNKAEIQSLHLIDLERQKESAEEKVQELKELLINKSEEQSALVKQITSLKTELNTILAEKEVAEHKIQDLNQLLLEKTEELSSMSVHKSVLDEQVTQLSEALELANQEVVAYALSNSWKITRPLRKISNKLRRIP